MQGSTKDMCTETMHNTNKTNSKYLITRHNTSDMNRQCCTVGNAHRAGPISIMVIVTKDEMQAGLRELPAIICLA